MLGRSRVRPRPEADRFEAGAQPPAAAADAVAKYTRKCLRFMRSLPCNVHVACAPIRSLALAAIEPGKTNVAAFSIRECHGLLAIRVSGAGARFDKQTVAPSSLHWFYQAQ